jgi:hypothetical protein
VVLEKSLFKFCGRARAVSPLQQEHSWSSRD